MSRTLKIAVVDDEPDMRESISQWLALSGFDAETFATAEEALKALAATLLHHPRALPRALLIGGAALAGI